MKHIYRMDSTVYSVLVVLSSLLVVLGHQATDPLRGGQGQGHHAQQQQQQQQGVEAHHARGNILRNKDNVGNKDHIMEHLDGVIDKPKSEMTEEELHFHYFQLHDYDKNNKLDGIELIAAMSHHHKEEDPNSVGQTEEELRDMVDTILEEDDRNNDGYIDYTEFVMSQKED